MRKRRKSLAPESDAATIEGVARGDTGSLEGLYRDYFPMILNMVLRNSGTEDEAKDVFQEAVIVLYDNVKQRDFELTSRLKTYLYSVCRRLWLKQLASKDRMFRDEGAYDDVIAVEEDLARHDEKDLQLTMMEQALDELGEPCRTIIRDYYIANLSMQEICEKFGYTNADNAKTQKYKCLQRLKKLFFTATK
ncbi:RNA polymerase sigma factor [Parapedobacter sp. 10938]|uniref:RNA polymerase sigma factor n=1 Tax=Parapedobacter flavus TaxID=3110225 RepID=UPI002DBAE939|nr:sigma-70 family RNA polymerase sigma factor [Parapedobacter sp. 10938]MEC3878275.1 sigma-70 family RNA polymerase sigma factor [Parapedobacter sp. 10938]